MTRRRFSLSIWQNFPTSRLCVPKLLSVSDRRECAHREQPRSEAANDLKPLAATRLNYLRLWRAHQIPRTEPSAASASGASLRSSWRKVTPWRSPRVSSPAISPAHLFAAAARGSWLDWQMRSAQSRQLPVPLSSQWIAQALSVSRQHLAASRLRIGIL